MVQTPADQDHLTQDQFDSPRHLPAKQLNCIYKHDSDSDKNMNISTQKLCRPERVAGEEGVEAPWLPSTDSMHACYYNQDKQTLNWRLSAPSCCYWRWNEQQRSQSWTPGDEEFLFWAARAACSYLKNKSSFGLFVFLVWQLWSALHRAESSECHWRRYSKTWSF